MSARRVPGRESAGYALARQAHLPGVPRNLIGDAHPGRGIPDDNVLLDDGAAELFAELGLRLVHWDEIEEWDDAAPLRVPHRPLATEWDDPSVDTWYTTHPDFTGDPS